MPADFTANNALDIGRDRYINLGTAIRVCELNRRAVPEGEAWLAHLLTARDEQFKKARGSSTLCVGVGILRITGEEKTEAPLVVAPARLTETKGGFYVEVDAFEAEVNPALKRLLLEKYALDISAAQPETDAVREAIGEGFANWSITNDAVLACFDTTSCAVYEDVKRREAQTAKHVLCACAVSGQKYSAGIHAFDDMTSDEALILPLPSDVVARNAVRLLASNEHLLLSGDNEAAKTALAVNAACHVLSRGGSVLYCADDAALREDFLKAADAAGVREYTLSLPAGNMSEKLRAARDVRNAPVYGLDDAKSTWSRLCEEKRAVEHAFDAVRKVRSVGLRYYEIVERCVTCVDEQDGVEFSAADAAELRHDGLTHRQSLVAELASAAIEANGVVNHPLREINRKLYSRKQEDETREAVANAARLAADVAKRAMTLANAWNLPAPVKKRDYEQLSAMAETAAKWEELPSAWLRAPDMAVFLSLAKEITAKGKRVSDTRSRLLCTFAEPALTIDAQGFLSQWTESEARIMTRGAVQGRIMKELTTLLRHGAKLDKKQAPGMLSAIAAYQKEQSALVKMLPEAGGLLSSFWKDVYTDWIKVEGYLRTAFAADDALLQSLGSREACSLLYARCAEGDVSGAKQFAAAWSAFDKACGEVFGELEIDDGAFDCAVSYADNCAEALARYSANYGELRQWIAYKLVRNQAIDAGLLPVVEALESGMEPARLAGAWMKGTFGALLEYSTEDDEILRDFDCRERDKKLFELTELERAARATAKAALLSTLSERRPAMRDDALPYSEEGILVRAAEQSGVGLRTLTQRLPTLLGRVFPVLTGSSADVARAGAGAFDAFDLVVVDGKMDLDAALAVAGRGRAVLVTDRARSRNPLYAALEASGVEKAECSFSEGSVVPPEKYVGANYCDSAFLGAVAKSLEPYGVKCRCGAGPADMALYHAEMPDMPVLALLYDGESMRERSFFDRETVVSTELLEANWSVVNVYCEEWRSGLDKLSGRLLKRLDGAYRDAKRRRELERARAKIESDTQKPAVAQEVPVSLPAQDVFHGFVEKPVDKPVYKHVEKASEVAAEAFDEVFDEVFEQATKDEDAGIWHKEEYATAPLELTAVPQEHILEGLADELMREKLKAVIAVEAPIEKKLLLKRVLASFGTKRAGARLIAAAAAALNDVPAEVRHSGDRSFYYVDEEQANSYHAFRSEPRDAPRRTAEELPNDECANAVCAVLARGGTLTAMNLAREAAYLMDFMRLGISVEAAMLEGIERAVNRGDAVSADGMRYKLATRS